MPAKEHAVRFSCNGAHLIGILSLPVHRGPRGVLIVVGGPQYRAGSHRQFTLLARHLAAHGIPVLRFDYRGMGDSEGAARSFEGIHDDIECAINFFYSAVPGLHDVVIWGLCDAASAAIFYAHRDARVSGIALLNPWIRSEASVAKTYLRHYYLKKILSRALWEKALRGEIRYAASIRSFIQTGIASMMATRPAFRENARGEGSSTKTLSQRLLEGLSRFNGHILLIVSGNDLTAREFQDVTSKSREWERLLRAPRVRRHAIDEANHTFSTRAWRGQVARWTTAWVQSW